MRRRQNQPAGGNESSNPLVQKSFQAHPRDLSVLVTERKLTPVLLDIAGQEVAVKGLDHTSHERMMQCSASLEPGVLLSDAEVDDEVLGHPG